LIDIAAARSKLDQAKEAKANEIRVTKAWLAQAVAEIEACRSARAPQGRPA
jgi:hypothetical protein